MMPLRNLVGACLALGLLATAPATTSAQPTTLETFLEQRVVEELAADGIVLSRLRLVLQVEMIDTRALVSLIDPDTGRAVASTKVDAMPPERETAVATLGPVVANLVAQYAGRTPEEAAERERLARIEQTQRELLARDQAARAESARLAQAEAQYQAEALRFDRDIAMVTTNGSDSDFAQTYVHYRWRATRGETGERLADLDYYRLIERPDLAAAYERRHTIATYSAVASLGLMLGGALLFAHQPTVAPDYRGCHTGDSFNDSVCRMSAESDARDAEEEQAGPWRTAGIIATLGSAIGLGVAGYYHLRPHPITEGEARRLGAAYNNKVRHRLGLPTAAPPPPVSTVRWEPYVARDGGGLTLSGRF